MEILWYYYGEWEEDDDDYWILPPPHDDYDDYDDCDDYDDYDDHVRIIGTMDSYQSKSSCTKLPEVGGIHHPQVIGLLLGLPQYVLFLKLYSE